MLVARQEILYQRSTTGYPDFEIFVHQLWGKPAYENSISDFLKADKAEQYAFDDGLRDHVYDILCKACGASGSGAKSDCIDCS